MNPTNSTNPAGVTAAQTQPSQLQAEPAKPVEAAEPQSQAAQPPAADPAQPQAEPALLQAQLAQLLPQPTQLQAEAAQPAAADPAQPQPQPAAPEPAEARPAPIAPLGERFDDIERIAVLRGGGLGDLLFALPAIDALAAAYPGAAVTLLGTPLARALLAGRPSSVTDVELLPLVPGVHLPAGQREDPSGARRFTERMIDRRFDLVAQLHGGGRNSNPFVRGLGARHTIGLVTPDAERLERTLDYLYYQHEVLRFLEVAGLAGAAPVTLEPKIHVLPSEVDAATRRFPDDAHGLVVLHPGATDPRRRWPAESFGELAARLVLDGRQVIVVGDESDALLAERIVETARRRIGPARASGVSSLAGTQSLGDLMGLFRVADVVVGNDSGPRHLAQAVGARTVGIFWVGNLINAGPFGRGLNRVQLSWTTHCPVCGRDSTQVGWTAERCEHDVSFTGAVGVDAVHEDVLALLPG